MKAATHAPAPSLSARRQRDPPTRAEPLAKCRLAVPLSCRVSCARAHMRARACSCSVRARACSCSVAGAARSRPSSTLSSSGVSSSPSPTVRMHTAPPSRQSRRRHTHLSDAVSHHTRRRASVPVWLINASCVCAVGCLAGSRGQWAPTATPTFGSRKVRVRLTTRSHQLATTVLHDHRPNRPRRGRAAWV